MLNKDQESIHLLQFVDVPDNWVNLELEKKWIELRKIKDASNVSIEEKRSSKEIGSSLEASLEIKLGEKLYEIAKKYDLSEICITSYANLVQDKNLEDKIIVKTKKAVGNKCPICWKIRMTKCERQNCNLNDAK